ncbi:MAG: methionyl-tRNA formyltransferase [Propionibacteriaceae bacterium]
MRLAFAGTPEVALPSLDALVASEHDVVAVVTRPDAPRGRGRTLHPSPVAARAAELGIETLKPTKPRDPNFVARLVELAPDCCPVVAYGALVPQHVIDIPTHGWVNLHFSVLPRWRGAAPVQHAVLAGDETSGASTFSLVAALDAGAVYQTLTEPIGPTDTSGDLLQRLSHSGAALLVATLDGIAAGTLSPVEQPMEGITLAPKISVADARLDWTLDAATLDRRIRGCSPAPGAWTTFRGDRFKVGSAAVDAEGATLAPGEVEVTKKQLRVGSGTVPLVLGEVQAQGKKPMRGADWARGVSIAAGESLGR